MNYSLNFKIKIIKGEKVLTIWHLHSLELESEVTNEEAPLMLLGVIFPAILALSLCFRTVGSRDRLTPFLTYFSNLIV